MSRFKGLVLVDKVLEELWKDICNSVKEVMIKIIPKEKKWEKAKWLSEECLQMSDERREAKGKWEWERYFKLNVKFQRIARRD